MRADDRVIEATGPASERLERLPVLVLFPHSRCNCRCVMCDIWRDERREQLTADEVERWAADWVRLGVRRVVLSGGEPLLHRDAWRLCTSLRTRGIAVTMLSTGVTLATHAEALVRHVDELVVSLDGPPEVHDAIRRIPAAFARLEAGTDEVRRHAPSFPIVARCTVQRANCHALDQTVGAARALRLSRISFLAADVSSEAFGRPEPWDAAQRDSVAPGDDDLAALEGSLAALETNRQEEFATGFIAEPPDKLRRRLLDYFRALRGIGGFPPVACNAPWVSAVVEADGTVRPCFFHRAVGNVRTAGSLEAVLNGPDAMEFRRTLDVATNAICQRCVCSLKLRAGADGSALQ